MSGPKVESRVKPFEDGDGGLPLVVEEVVPHSGSASIVTILRVFRPKVDR